MTPERLARFVATGLRFSLAAIFIFAAALKLGDVRGFADKIAAYKLLPAWSPNLAALTLPLAELAAGALAIAGTCRRTALFGMALLGAIFSVALASALARGLVIDCGCFGGGDASVQGMLLALGRATLIMVAAAWLWARLSTGQARHRQADGSAPPARQVRKPVGSPLRSSVRSGG